MICKYYLTVLLIGVVTARENNAFRIRKCCAEDELILEVTGECINSKLFKNRHNIYKTGNETVIGDMKNEGTRPWWFPTESNILSKENNDSLEKFPAQSEIIFGEGQPCEVTRLSLLPSYYYKYDFYEDGSLLVYENHNQKGNIIYDPLSYCVDILDPTTSDSETSTEAILEINEVTEYMILLCPCSKATCVLKCCEPGLVINMESLSDGGNPCVLDPRKNAQLDSWKPRFTDSYNESKNYYLLHRFPLCPEGESNVVANFVKNKTKQYTIYSNGSAQILGETHMSEPFNFCGEHVIRKGVNMANDYIIRCYPKTGIVSPWVETRKILYGSMLIIGTFFLFLTLLVYALLPTVKTINDKNLISQTCSLFVGYFCTAISQLAIGQLPDGICVFFGFLIQYSFLAAFFWLNVLCIDISWTFSELRVIRGIPTDRLRRKFIYYSLYAWGCPSIISLATVTVEFAPNIPTFIVKPGIKDKCWFRNDSLAKLVYFYGPIAVLLIANVFLFVFTSFRILQTQRDTSSLIKNRTTDKKRFTLYLKLFLLMGLSWITELISWAVGGPDYYWYIPDIVNVLRAVFIFIILCCKPQVKEELKKRLSLMKQTDFRRPSNARTNSFYLTTIQMGQEGLTKNQNVMSSL